MQHEHFESYLIFEQQVLNTPSSFTVFIEQVSLISHNFVDQLVYLMLQLPSYELGLHLEFPRRNVDLLRFFVRIVSHF